jgi:hypothetical protein
MVWSFLGLLWFVFGAILVFFRLQQSKSQFYKFQFPPNSHPGCLPVREMSGGKYICPRSPQNVFYGANFKMILATFKRHINPKLPRWLQIALLG